MAVVCALARVCGPQAVPTLGVAAIDTLAQDNYISLTTFKRDGTGVATPVWSDPRGDHLYVITDSDSGKAEAAPELQPGHGGAL